jgi:O-antigen/teichoic acid export membrane protein
MKAVPSMKKFGFDVVTTLTRQLIGLGLGLGLTILLARGLGVAGNGMYAIATLLPILLTTLLNMGIASANVYYIARGEVSLQDASRTTLWLWGICTGVGIFSTAFLIWFQGGNLFPGVPNYLLWLGLATFPILMLHTQLSSIFQGIQDFRRLNLITLTPLFATTIFTAIAIFAFDLGLIGALFAFFFAQAVTVVVVIFSLKKYFFAKKPSVSVKVYGGKCIRYAWKAHVSNIVSFLNYRIDLYFVNFLLGPISTGVYAVSIQFAERLWILSHSISYVLLPFLSSQYSKPDATSITPLIVRMSFLLTIGAAVVLALLGKIIIGTFLGEEFLPSYTVLLWLLPGVVLASITKVLSNDIAARGRPDLNMYVSIILLGTNLIANLILIPVMGIYGAALATTLVYTLDAVIKVYLFTTLSNDLWWSIFLFRSSDFLLIKKLVSPSVKIRSEV